MPTSIQGQSCLPDNLSVLPPEGKNNARISTHAAFLCVCNNLPLQGSISWLLKKLEDHVKAVATEKYGVSLGNGVNNARGRWLEMALQVLFWNVCLSYDKGKTMVMKLPDASELQFRDLYEPQAKRYLDELFMSLEKRGLDMQMSNPDFLCVTDLPEGLVGPKPVTVSLNTLQQLDNFYKKVVGKCQATSIPFALTVKSSLRSDRRYQVVHEANVVKSLVAHLGGRFWNSELYTGFYAMVASNVSIPDKKALSNPATHTLVQVNWEPVPLIDEVYSINQTDGVKKILLGLLQTHLEKKEPPTAETQGSLLGL